MIEMNKTRAVSATVAMNARWSRCIHNCTNAITSSFAISIPRVECMRPSPSCVCDYCVSSLSPTDTVIHRGPPTRSLQVHRTINCGRSRPV